MDLRRLTLLAVIDETAEGVREVDSVSLRVSRSKETDKEVFRFAERSGMV